MTFGLFTQAVYLCIIIYFYLLYSVLHDLLFYHQHTVSDSISFRIIPASQGR